MAVFRILEARARPGAIDRLAELLVRQNERVVSSTPGALFAQALRSGDQVLAVSSWRSADDVARYLDQEVTQAFYRALTDLLMGTPSVRTYEVLGSGGTDGGAAAWTDGGAAGDGGPR
ncbi:putative quinol monooxygenase [Geodermatophilus sp. SYSU D00758]